MSGDAFWEFERAGWDRAAERYEECWTDTALFLEPLLDAAGVGAGSRLLDAASGPGLVSEAALARGAGVCGATRTATGSRCRSPPASSPQVFEATATAPSASGCLTGRGTRRRCRRAARSAPAGTRP